MKILVLEDDEPIRRRLVRILGAEPDVTIIEAATLAEARQALCPVMPDVLIVDLQLPDGHAITLIADVCRRAPASDILVISVLADEASVVSAIEAGASGYLLKDALPADIVETVRNVRAGFSPLSPRIARFILDRLRATPATSNHSTRLPTRQGAPDVLTPRELDVLWGIAKGLKYAEISRELGISTQTVASHVKNIFHKLQVSSRSEAVFEACQQQLIKL